MNIAPVNFSHNTRPAFGTCSRGYVNAGKKVVTYTTAYRPDLQWLGFAELLGKSFPNARKVHTHVLACSDGSEPFSLAIALRKVLRDAADKFLPIKASDLDKEVLKPAMNGKWNMLPDEADCLRDYLTTAQTPVEIANDFYAPNTGTYGLGAFLKKSINFKCSPISNELPAITKPDTVVLCRNVLPHLTPEDYREVVQTLPKAKNGNFFVIGGFDRRKTNIINLLDLSGFEEVITNVFRKR